MTPIRTLATLFLIGTLAGCNAGSGDDPGTNGQTRSSAVASDKFQFTCEHPLPPEVREFLVTSPLPNSYDRARTDDTLDSDETRFRVAVMLPQRCDHQRFPVVIESHGYSGSRDATIDDDGQVDPAAPHFPAIDELFATLPRHGYVGVSFDERGHGESVPANGGGYARIIDARAETQDARALLDWLYDHAEELHVQTEDDSGTARDIRVGLIGYSYGGGFQLQLGQLDPRVDTLVPNGTWHSLMHSLLPGDASKRGFTGLLCLLADTGGVVNTPIVARMCELMGYDSAQANQIRTRSDLVGTMAADGFSEEEILNIFDRHTRYLQRQAANQQPWCTPGELGCSSTGDAFEPRAVPTLLLQGNRDVLFNLTEAYWNWKFLSEVAGEDANVTLLSTEGGHMNPLANQREGTANCGGIIGVEAVKAWFDFHLKGESSAAYRALPRVCISVADTESADTASPAGLILKDFPVGSQSGPGGIAVRQESISAEVDALAIDPVFVPLHLAQGDSQILAGAPRLDSITITDSDADLPGNVAAIAYIGIGIQRGDQLILVDDQVTTLIAGEHHSNPNIGEPGVLLNAVGERLQDGDRVGLLLYPRHIQYEPILNPASIAGAEGLAATVLGVELPPVISSLDPQSGVVNPPNPYQVQAQGVELPIIDLAEHPTARLSQ